MKFITKLYVTIIFALVTHCATAQPDPSSNWQCTSQDQDNKVWTAKNTFHKVALHFALAACKGESNFPASCKVLKGNCVGFNQESSNAPLWRCTSLDRKAQSWTSDYHENTDNAALSAYALCKAHSSVADTCYVNLITCQKANGAFY